ncbi:MAG TPA: SGNH/GDSL hydrolase family protein [Arsenicitalea sp.]|jgi:lysophospholipase L1-like esterase|nr:SGNH/GDSL hydrolase family protein [Arsenicitalea sp.]
MQAFRIVSFGTSLSAGGGWQADLCARLQSELGRDVEVLIHAKPGASSAWGVETVANVAALDLDLILLEFAINDASLLRGVSLAQSRANLARMVAALRAEAPGRQIMLMTMSPPFRLKRLVRPLLGRYYALCRQVAIDLQLDFIDLRSEWAKLPASELRRAIPDNLHPTPEAARKVIVPPLAEAIVGLVRSANL